MIQSFISEIGGPLAVSLQLSEMAGEPIRSNTVSMWAKRDSIPYRWRAAVISIANEKGVSVPDEIKQGVIVEARAS